VKVFDFDPSDYAAEFAREGWIHIRAGVSEEFHAYMVEFARRELGDHLLPDFAIKGKKEQALFEFPPQGIDYPDELFDTVAAVTGLERDSITLSERHIQAYELNAAPEPPAHKDRFPSQISCGLSITIPAESRLVLYPHSHRELNPFNTSAGLRRSLQPDELPDVALKDARPVELDDADRDVVLFHGSTTWHLRRRAAGALNLYCKFNDFGCDPLGEDPRTPALREATVAAVRSSPPGEQDVLLPVLARRFDTVLRVYTRQTWQESLQARVFGEEPFGITELERDVLLSADGRRSLAGLSASVPGEPEGVRRAILRLAEQGALDLVPPGTPPPGRPAQAHAADALLMSAESGARTGGLER
jgi:hypothetical protein